jgi:hypothetical protein
VRIDGRGAPRACSARVKRHCIAVTLVALAPRFAAANGRFPSAQQVVVGPGASATALAVATTFGIFVSRDGGASFAWVCEEALSAGGRWDLALALGADGSLSLGLPDGARRGADDCDFARSFAGAPVIDLAASPDGERVYGAAHRDDGAALLLRSTDRGGAYATLPLALDGVTLTTLDVAPSRAGRLWAVGARGTPSRAVLLRSDDDGARFEVASDDLAGAETAYLSAVDARDPERLWVRVPRGATTELLRTEDGGRSWRSALTVRGAMEGFALAADGRVWAGGSAAGLWRSSDGGRFEAVDDAPVLCLRHHAGALYVCTDHTREGVALVRLRDGAGAFEPLLRYRDAEGVPDCPGSAPVFAACAPLWREQRALLLRQVRDAGGADAADAAAPTDATVDRPMDAAVGKPGAPSGGCGCAAPPRGAGSPWWLALLARRRRRRDTTPSR